MLNWNSLVVILHEYYTCGIKNCNNIYNIMYYILFGLVIFGSLLTFSRGIYMYMDEFYDLDFDIFLLSDE